MYIFLNYTNLEDCMGARRGRGGRVLNEELYFSGFRIYSLTAVIQHEVILSIPVFLRPTCNEDIIIAKEVLQARHLDSKVYKAK